MGFRAIAAALVMTLGLGVAQAREFVVTADQAGLIRLPGDASGVIVGNPGIADAMLYDSRTLFVTGKVFGRTNLIVLDEAGRVLYAASLAKRSSRNDGDRLRKFLARFGLDFDRCRDGVGRSG